MHWVKCSKHGAKITMLTWKKHVYTEYWIHCLQQFKSSSTVIVNWPNTGTNTICLPNVCCILWSTTMHNIHIMLQHVSFNQISGLGTILTICFHSMNVRMENIPTTTCILCTGMKKLAIFGPRKGIRVAGMVPKYPYVLNYCCHSQILKCIELGYHVRLHSNTLCLHSMPCTTTACNLPHTIISHIHAQPSHGMLPTHHGAWKLKWRLPSTFRMQNYITKIWNLQRQHYMSVWYICIIPQYITKCPIVFYALGYVDVGITKHVVPSGPASILYARKHIFLERYIGQSWCRYCGWYMQAMHISPASENKKFLIKHRDTLEL